MTDFNTKLNELATGFLATAKNSLSRDGALMPVVFLIDKDMAEIKAIGLKFDGHEQKRKAYDAVTQMAIESNAHAIIMINDVRYRNIAPDKARETMANIGPGDICDDERNPEALVMAVLPRHGAEYFVMAKYIRLNNAIVFGSEDRMDNGPGKAPVQFNLIPESWRKAVTANSN